MNRTRRSIVVIALAVLPLAACELPAPRPEPEPEPAKPAPVVVERPACEPRVAEVYTGVDDTLLFLAGLRNKSQTDLKTALYQARKDFADTGSEGARMRLALLYLHPGTSFHSEAQALQLLEPYVRGDANARSPYRGIAQLVLANLDESRRTDATVQAQVQKTREEQKRADELQRKLDALKDVERAMILKDQNTRKR
jgi:hypothetical protein